MADCSVPDCTRTDGSRRDLGDGYYTYMCGYHWLICQAMAKGAKPVG